MSEILTLTEIQARYPSEWVLIDHAQLSPSSQLLGGKVVWHSKDRDEVYRKAIEFRPACFAFRYTGPHPEDIITRLFAGTFEPVP